MAIHPNVWSLAEEALSEYLATIRICIDHRKHDGGCLGYPAALLSLCVVNAIGTYLRNEEVPIEGRNQRVTRGEPFRVLNHPLFGQNLTSVQIKAVEKNYRNLLAHNAMLAAGAFLVPGAGTSPFVFTKKQIEIHVEALYKMVSAAWDKLDKSKIRMAIENGFVKTNP